MTPSPGCCLMVRRPRPGPSFKLSCQGCTSIPKHTSSSSRAQWPLSKMNGRNRIQAFRNPITRHGQSLLVNQHSNNHSTGRQMLQKSPNTGVFLVTRSPPNWPITFNESTNELPIIDLLIGLLSANSHSIASVRAKQANFQIFQGHELDMWTGTIVP